MANNLYSQADVDYAISRAKVAMYLISDKIQKSFYYLDNPIYTNYKDLQWDIYTLYSVLTYNEGFVNFSEVPTTFETHYYNLVGALINKVKQVDVFGLFGSTINSNFQNTIPTIVEIISGQVTANAIRIPFTAQTVVTLGNYQANYATKYGNFPNITIWTSNGDGTYTQDTATLPTITNTGGDINLPNSYTWTYAIATTGYIEVSGFIIQ